jgi:hypothetical protein
MNLGNALRDLGRLAEAYPCYERALALRPGFGDARYNLAFAQLLDGDYARGWATYAARWDTRKLTGHRRSFTAPTWDGADPTGRTILVYAEQGMGDVLQFCRYLPLVRARGARTVLLIDGVWQQLAPVLRNLDGVDQLALDVAEVARIDAQCALLDLPHLLGTTLATVPAHIPYLAVDPARHPPLADTGLPRIGLVWAGNPNFPRDHLRSPRLPALLPLLEVPGLSWFALQMGDGRRDLEGRAMPARFTDLAPSLGDFADTAAVMAELDLVITSCTATAHLAGALGRPTWVLLPAAPDWRWLLAREDSPWYPTVRLFRQPQAGDWAALVERVRDELVALAAGDRSRLAPSARAGV